MNNAPARIERERLLDEQRFLERSIEDLDGELAAGDVSAADYERLRGAYAVRASDVAAALEAPALAPALWVQESDGRTGEDGGDERGRTQWWRLRRTVGRRRTAIGWAALCCFVAAAVLLVLGLAGVAPLATSSGPPALSVTARIRTELAEAAALAENHNVLEAVAVYDRVLAFDPRQPEALAEGGWLARLAGLSSHRAAVVKGGDREIAEAVAVAPGLAVPRLRRDRSLRGRAKTRCSGSPVHRHAGRPPVGNLALVGPCGCDSGFRRRRTYRSGQAPASRARGLKHRAPSDPRRQPTRGAILGAARRS